MIFMCLVYVTVSIDFMRLTRIPALWVKDSCYVCGIGNCSLYNKLKFAKIINTENSLLFDNN